LLLANPLVARRLGRAASTFPHAVLYDVSPIAHRGFSVPRVAAAAALYACVGAARSWLHARAATATRAGIINTPTH